LVQQLPVPLDEMDQHGEGFERPPGGHRDRNKTVF
jgi:hypothetical protein